ncbi:hypothetical protein FA95DRAFT_1554982 [Auriscalpium vulgare]|uniref:Uncharacterized protein n=1 Tax=Auriscalpium vulgare TaxID=40419 RepID=A0ACB8S458_9AGAM|nr:hypothetical protein FA95DRAFT_1554982 [Auriscalpium vulgare]
MEDRSLLPLPQETQLPDGITDVVSDSALSYELPTTKCFITSLPIELLGEIFVLVPGMEFDEIVADPLVALHKPLWVGISHVCRTWRSATLNLKSFWTFIALQMGPIWVETCLARSHPAPISIHIVNPYLAYPWYRSLAIDALRELPRTRRLLQVGKMPGGAGDLSTALGDRVAKMIEHAPFLTDLSLCNVDLRTSFGTARQLRTLALTNPSLNMDADADDGMWQVIRSDSSVCTSIRVLNVLAKLPGLRTLHLWFNIHLPTLEKLPVICLPHLRELRLVGGTLVILEILQHLTYPTDIDLHFECTGAQHHNALSRALHTLAEVLQKYLASARQTHRSLTIGEGLFDLFRTARTVNDHPHRRLHIGLRCQVGLESWLETGIFQVILGTSAVEELDIEDDQDRDFDTWKTISSHLPRVQRISFAEPRAARSLARALSDMTAPQNLFHNLHEIHIPSIYKYPNGDWSTGTDGVASTPRVDEQLISTLSWGLAQPRMASSPLRLVVHERVERDIADVLRDYMDPGVEMSIDWDSATGCASIVWIRHSYDTDDSAWPIYHQDAGIF